MEPKIIFEDEDLLVLDKPAGMTVNRADTTKGEVTLQDWVEKYLSLPRVSRVPKVSREDAQMIENSRDAFFERAGIVHRLDKETSGILLIAKTPEAFLNMQAQFKERKVQKTYTALVHGKVEPEEGEIVVPVGRLPWNRKRFGVLADGKEATTKFKVQSSTLRLRSGQEFKVGEGTLSLLELYPKTGRTHQIRVHLKYVNHPIFSDPLYGGRKQARNDRKNLPRVFLHASKISFTHPRTGETISFESPLPKELSEFLKKIEVKSLVFKTLT
ncbi:MAG: RluA family pseudouridine synthase [Candidatus Levybacteria bacterium]|nr:RluA family pseudouridine synthase [Candidatus Levybacteria bacterium]